MEANSSALKNSLPLAVGPMKFSEESPKRKASFMVDDIVRDANILMSATFSDRSLSLTDSSYRNTVPHTTDGAPLSKPGKNRVNYSHSISIL